MKENEPDCALVGFTLIELSIVLVIIGLIVGGVLAGQELVRSAQVRNTISQIERYNTAANTFREKYGYLPGDIKDPAASSFGLAARGQYAGEGDGNGVIEGITANSPGSNAGNIESGGETCMFWVDLSAVHMIDNTFTRCVVNTNPGVQISGPQLLYWFPASSLANNAFVYVWSTGGVNYFSISGVPYTFSGGQINGTATLPVRQVYAIDNKADDGFPQTGNITAAYVFGNSYPQWSGPSDTSATTGSSTTCYDNGGSAGGQQQYSVEISGGANTNCGIRFKMQAGD